MPDTAREFFEQLATRTADGSERTRGLTATYRFCLLYTSDAADEL